MRIPSERACIVLVALLLAGPALAAAPQQAAPPAQPPQPQTQAAEDEKPAAAAGTAAPAAARTGDDQDAFNPAQPDFTVVNLPTTLRLPPWRMNFRLSHRFARPLDDGDFGDLVSDLFGFDSAALIGLELKIGLWKGFHAGVYRTNDKTIELTGQYSLMRQGANGPVSIDALAAADGTDNFSDSYSPALGAIVSRTIGQTAAVYATPMWVNNSNALPSEVVDDNDTFVLGLAARVRIRPSVYVVAEVTPRLAGYDPGDTLATFGIERRAGRHIFQLNFSNSIGTAFSQIARGGGSDWYIGFNLSRKFY